MKIIASSDHLLEEKEHLAMDLGRNGYPDTFTRASSTSRRHTARDMREYPHFDGSTLCSWGERGHFDMSVWPLSGVLI